MTDKPRTYNEIVDLCASGDIEVLAISRTSDGQIKLTVQDNRRGPDDGEIYECVMQNIDSGLVNDAA